MFAIAMLTVDWLYHKHSGLVVLQAQWTGCTAMFNASSIEALHDESNELEDAWELTCSGIAQDLRTTELSRY